MKNVNNWRLESWLSEKSGGTATITDNISSFTFGIGIDSYFGMASLDLAEAESYINKNKPSHLSYEMRFTSKRTANTYIGVALHKFNSLTVAMEQVSAESLLCLMDENGSPLMDENNIALF